MKDLTKGRPSVLILTFALPIFLANLLQLTYSLADTRIVGTFLGDNALAAVGATTTLSNLIVQFLMGMCNGFAIISAQCFGAKDMDRLRRSLGNSLVLGLLATVVLTFGGLVFLQPILRFLNVPENLLNTATQYVSVIIAGLVITLLYDVLSATLRAIGDTVTPLIVLAVSVVLNIGGDLLLIMVLHMGVLGAAVATVLSQLIAVVVCAVYLWKKYEILRIRVDDLKLQDAGMLRNMLSSGLSMGFMSSLVNIGTLTLQTSINKLGQNIIIAQLAEGLTLCLGHGAHGTDICTCHEALVAFAGQDDAADGGLVNCLKSSLQVCQDFGVQGVQCLRAVDGDDLDCALHLGFYKCHCENLHFIQFSFFQNSPRDAGGLSGSLRRSGSVVQSGFRERVLSPSQRW